MGIIPIYVPIGVLVILVGTIIYVAHKTKRETKKDNGTVIREIPPAHKNTDIIKKE